MSRPSRSAGRRAEQLAAIYLTGKGLSLIARNFSSRVGEIDLIMRDRRPDCLVFIEVRYRRSAQFGGAAASVVAGKQTRLLRAASLFNLQHPGLAALPQRFDVLGIEGALWRPRMNWIKNAFETAD